MNIDNTFLRICQQLADSSVPDGRPAYGEAIHTLVNEIIRLREEDIRLRARIRKLVYRFRSAAYKGHVPWGIIERLKMIAGDS